MRIGSLVVVKPIQVINLKHFVRWLPVMDERTVYTIRDIGPTWASLEEGIIGYLGTKEIVISQDHLIEIQPPMNLTELIKETEQLELVE